MSYDNLNQKSQKAQNQKVTADKPDQSAQSFKLTKNKSEHLQKYCQFLLQDNSDQHQKNIQEIHHQLRKDLLQSIGQSQLIHIHFQKQDNNTNTNNHHQYKFCITEIKITYSPNGIFYTVISVLFVPSHLEIHSADVFQEGSNGLICLSFNEQTQSFFATKCFRHRPTDSLKINLFMVIKQYVISMIMSQLKIGPKLTKDFGFDIIVYENYIQFTMEFCTQVKYRQNSTKNLKQNLITMHALNIFHMDIKHNNILYSKTFQKQVLIDFGYSQLCMLQVGYKTLLKGYKGTYEYSSQQMKKCLQQPTFVDLFYNDLYALNKAINYYQRQIQRQTQKNENKKFQNQQQKQYELIKNDNFASLRLKYYIYKEQNKKAQKLLNNHNSESLQELIRFLKSYTPNNFLKQFYAEVLTHKIKNFKCKDYFDRKLNKYVKFQFLVETDKDQIKIANYLQHIKLQLFNINDLQSNKIQQQGNQNKSNANANTNINIQKKLIFDISFIKNAQKQVYFQYFFDFVTFKENFHQATLDEKDRAASQFMQFLGIQQGQSLLYKVQNKSICKCIVCIKYLMSYCENPPFTRIKKKLFPKLCSEFTLINPHVFTSKNPLNYLSYWFKTIYLQNKDSLLQMISNILQILFAHKMLLYRDNQIYYQNYSQGDLQNCLRFLWNDKQYLLSQLSSYQVINQLFILLKFVKKANLYQVSFQQLKVQIFKCQKLDRTSKMRLLKQIQSLCAIQRAMNLDRLQLYIENQYRRVNLRRLSEESFQLCIFFKQSFNYFNCRQCLQNIEYIINCPQISQNFCGSIRGSIQLYFGSQLKSLSIFQQLVHKLNWTFSIKQTYLVQLLQFQNSLTYSLKNSNQKQVYHLQQKLNNITLQLVQKLTLYVNQLISIIGNIQEGYQNKKYNRYHLYDQLFLVLKLIIKSLQTQIEKKQIFYQLFDKYCERFIVLLPTRKKQIQQYKLRQLCSKMTDQNKYSQLSLILQDHVKKIDLTSRYSIRQNIHAILYFVLAYFRHKYNKNGHIIIDTQSNNYLYNLYKKILLTLYDYFIQTKDFKTSLPIDSPTFQILVYFIEQQDYKRFLFYLSALTNFISKFPNSIYISSLISSIFIVKKFTQFQKDKLKKLINCYFQIQNSNKQKKIQMKKYSKLGKKIQKGIIKNDDYWYVIICEVISWVNTDASQNYLETLKNISKCVQKLVFRAKQMVFEKYFYHAIKNIQLLTFYNKDYKAFNIIQLKKRNLNKKQLKYSKNKKYNLNKIFATKAWRIQTQDKTKKKCQINAKKNINLSFKSWKSQNSMTFSLFLSLDNIVKKQISLQLSMS